jgi:hypothetical protein
MSGGGGKASEKKGMNVLPFVQQFEGETRGVRQSLFGQIQEALSTGGVGARMPIINNAITQSQNATNRSLADIGTNLSRTGLAKTAFGNRQLAETRMTGAQNVANIGPEMATSLAGAGATSVQGIIQSILGGLGAQGQGSSKHGQGGF